MWIAIATIMVTTINETYHTAVISHDYGFALPSPLLALTTMTTAMVSSILVVGPSPIPEIPP